LIKPGRPDLICRRTTKPSFPQFDFLVLEGEPFFRDGCEFDAPSIGEPNGCQANLSEMRSKKIGIFLAPAISFVMFATNSPAQENVRATPENTVVILGDSNTSGYGVGPQESFSARLQENLRRGGWPVNVINGGVPGDTFGGMLDRVDFSVPENAGLVIVQGGYNDAANGVPPKVTEEKLNEILSRLQARGIKAVVCGFFDAKWDAVGRKLAAAHNARFVPGSACYDPTHVGEDGLHMSATGHAVVANRLTPLVQSNRKALPAVAR
jgi:acyl-CoA thioesterase-1